MSYKWSGDQTFGTANVGILNADTIKGASITSNMSIGANLNGGSISIGGINSSTKILGTLFADTINSSSTTLNIGNNISTLNLNIGTNLSSGVINIGSINKTTNISGSVNMSGSVNINTSGSGNTTIGNILSTTNISGSSINMSGSVNINTTGSATTTIGNGTVNINTTGNGNTIIGNATTSTYTAIESNGISIGKQLSGTGYIDIGGQANTTTGYIVVGSPSLDSLYLKAKNIYLFNPFSIYYSYNNNLNTLGALSTIAYGVTNQAGFATTKAYCSGAAVPVGIYLCFTSLRAYGLSSTYPFTFCIMRLSDTQQTNNTVPIGSNIGGAGGEYYQSVYAPSTGAGYAIQPVGTLVSTTTFKFPYISYYTDADTQSVYFTLNLVRVG